MKQNYAIQYVVTKRRPKKDKRYIHINWLGAYVMNAEKWLENEQIKLTNGDRFLKPWEPDPEWQLTNS